jgi:hypothetical protein
VAKGFRGLLQKAGVVPPEIVKSIAELTKGPVLIDGSVTSDEPLLSPIQSTKCVGYQYHSGCRIANWKGLSRQPLRRVRVWADTMRLSVEDGEVELIPPESSPFKREEHEMLKNHGYDDFKAAEWPVKLGKKVRVHGKAKRRGDGWTIEVIQFLETDKTIHDKK